MKRRMLMVFLLGTTAGCTTTPEEVTTTLPVCLAFCRSDTSRTNTNAPKASTVTVDGSFTGGSGGSSAREVIVP